MSSTNTYSGSCHCGKVAFDVTTDLSTVMECNCSHCSRRGALLTFVPPQQFVLKSGTTDLMEYRFHTKKIQHLLCETCGLEPFARGVGPDGKEMVAINVRCLPDVDIKALKITPFDGKRL